MHLKENDIQDIKEIFVGPEEINYYITLRPQATFCPECGSINIERKEWKTRKLKHKVFDGRKTTLIIKYCRYKCRECGKTFSEKNSLFLKNQNISFETIRKILDALIDLNATYTAVGQRFDVSATTICNIFDHYVTFKPGKLPEVLCIDEIYTGRQFVKPYACILLDHQTGKLIDILKGRQKLGLNNYFLGKSPSELEKVLFINMDMWETYLNVAKRCFPHATVAVDSFHVMENFSRSLHDVRCRVMKKFPEGSNQRFLLKKFKYLLYKSDPLEEKKFYSLKFKRFVSEQMVLDMMLSIDIELKLAYNFYHIYQRFNATATIEDAEERFDSIMNNSYQYLCVPELVSLIEMLQNWKPYILNSFIRFGGKRLSNGPIEGTNNSLKKIKKTMNGPTNFDRFRNKAFLSVNKKYTIHWNKENKVKKTGKRRGNYKKKGSEF